MRVGVYVCVYVMCMYVPVCECVHVCAYVSMEVCMCVILIENVLFTFRIIMIHGMNFYICG